MESNNIEFETEEIEKDNEKKKILYSIEILTHLNIAIAHSLYYHRNDEVVFIVDKKRCENRIADLKKVLIELKNEDIIQQVFFDNLTLDIKLKKNIEEYEEYVINYFDKIYNKYNLNLNDFYTLYCLNERSDGHVNLYYNIKGVRYVQIGINHDRIFDTLHPDIIANCSSEFLNLVNKWKPYSPFAPCCLPQIRNDLDENIRNKLCNKEFYSWDKWKAFEAIDEKTLDKILKSYNVAEVSKNATLYLPNSANVCNADIKRTSKIFLQKINFNIYSQNEVASILNKTVFDYYTNSETIYIKIHPNDGKLDFDKLYQGKIKWLSDAPFEFLSLYFENKNIVFENLIGVASTSLESMKENEYHQKLELGLSFIRTWFFYDSIFASFLIACKFDKKNIFSDINIAEQINLLKNRFSDLNLENYLKVNGIKYDFMKQAEDGVFIFDAIRLNREKYNINTFIKWKKYFAMIFLNVEYCTDFFEEEDYQFCELIKIEKKNIDNIFPDFSPLEYIWIYSKNNLEIIKDYSYKRKMYYRGFELNIKICSAEEKYEIFKKNVSKNRLNDMQIEYKNISQKVDFLYKCLPDQLFLKNEDVMNYIRKIDDISVYFDVLSVLKRKYCIFIGIKDSPAVRMDDVVFEKFINLGFTKFCRKSHWMYIGVLCNGIVICDNSAPDKDVAIDFSFSLNNVPVSIISQPFSNGNECKIIISGENVALNRRGINIVIWDEHEKKVIDSITYDGHFPTREIIR